MAEIMNGKCGENLTWEFTADGKLTITGSGDMENYEYKRNAPWADFADQIRSVCILPGVTSIGDDAFYNCSSLASVTIPDGVTSLGNDSFDNCISLASVTIPDSVTSIGDGVFFYCSSLTSVTIPGSVTNIGTYAFAASGLKKIRFEGKIPSLAEKVFNGVTAEAYYSAGDAPLTDDVKQICGDEITWNDGSSPASVTVPSGVTDTGKETIIKGKSGASAISSGKCGKNLTWEFTDDGTLTVSGPGDMENYEHGRKAPWADSADEIRSVCISTGVTSIGELAFCGCSILAAVTIPDSVTSIGDYAFEDCRSLASVTIPDSVTSIGNEAFSHCYSLTSVTLPDSETSIGNGAFSHCYSLASVAIPNGVTSIGDGAFEECYQLKEIHFEGEIPSFGEDVFRGVRADAYYPAGYVSLTKKVKMGGFGGIKWKKETDDYRHDTVRNTGKRGTCGENLTWELTDDGTLTISGSGDIKDRFSSSVQITFKSVRILSGVKSIGWSAFADCSSLETITLPDSLVFIGPDAFKDCSSLTSVTIPDSVAVIGDRAFLDCISLASVTIPGSVTSIGQAVFYNCRSLASVTIPAGVTNIGTYAFAAGGLKEIRFEGKVPSLGEDVFKGVTAEAHYPAGSASLTDEVKKKCGGSITWKAV